MKRQGVLTRLIADRRGNIMYMVAAMLVPILITIGAGVDMSQAYMAKMRLQQACDAGVLAARRAMEGADYTTANKAQASAMFSFNYPSGIYGSRDVVFDSTRPRTNVVTGTASATLPTLVMRAFGRETIALSVSCAARLEMPNTDVVMVLDVTGSMEDNIATTGTSSTTETKLAALKREAISFYNTLSAAMPATARLRVGVVPYSSTVNIGSAINSLNSSYIADTAEIPSRVVTWVELPGGTTTVTPESVAPWSSYSWTGAQLNNVTSSSNCPTTTTSEISANGPDQPPSVTYTDPNSTDRQFTTEVDRPKLENQYSYRWYNSACRQRVRSRTYVEETTTVKTLRYSYRHRMVEYDVSGLKTGGTLQLPIGFKGEMLTGSWNGCLRERQTTAFAASATPPATALDLDIDRVPDSDASRWRVSIPAFTFPSAVSGSGSSSTPAYNQNSIEPNDYVTPTNFNNYAAPSFIAAGTAACPTAVFPLATTTSTAFSNYIGSLTAVGGTYHDAGMVWGARMISPTGIWAASNAPPPGSNGVSRHILFMTDGQMAPSTRALSQQGVEALEKRVLGSADSSELTARHNARLLALCDAAKSRNITIWFVSFGESLDTTMKSCASGDRSFQASNSATLRTQFQSIATQIARLRLSE